MTWPAFITQSKEVNKCRQSLDRSRSRRPNSATNRTVHRSESHRRDDGHVVDRCPTTVADVASSVSTLSHSQHVIIHVRRRTTCNVSPAVRMCSLAYGQKSIVSHYWIKAINSWSRFAHDSLAVVDPRVGHTMDVHSPFISVLCHTNWLYHAWSPVHVLMLSIQAVCGLCRLRASIWHCSLHYLFCQATPLFPRGVIIR